MLLPESELKERITQLKSISFPRGEKLYEQIIKEAQKMTITYDIRKLSVYKEGVSEGLTQRISQGISQGEARALLTTARNMIKKGLDIQLIHETTSLPIAELKKITERIEIAIRRRRKTL